MGKLNVSVVITTYNRSSLVVRAVNSALAGCEVGDEVIVVDDGSSDDTESVLKESFGEKIKYLKLANGGLAWARNHGIRISSNELIAFLDDDDEWIPEKLALQRGLMQARSDVLFCFSNFYSRFRNGRVLSSCIFNWGQKIQSWKEIMGSDGIPYSSIASLPKGVDDFDVYIGDIYYHQMLNDYVLPTTLMVRKTDGFDVASFSEDMRFLESWPYSSLLASHGLAAYLDCDTACQHDHGGARLTDANQLTQIAARIKVLERQWGKDEEFLSVHGSAYRDRLDGERFLYIRELLANASSREAREQIRKLYSPAPSLLKFLSCFPDAVLRQIMALRRWLKVVRGA